MDDSPAEVGKDSDLDGPRTMAPTKAAVAMVMEVLVVYLNPYCCFLVNPDLVYSDEMHRSDHRKSM